MSSWKVALLLGSAVFYGCDDSETQQATNSISSPDYRIQQAQECIVLAKVAIKDFPRLDLFIQATRDYVILRQVELSEQPMDWKTLDDLAGARSRADEVLPMLAKFSPILVQIEKALQELGGSLQQIIILDELSPSSRRALGHCRTKIRDLLDDLQLAKDVLHTPEFVYPRDTDYYDPDFDGVLRTIESTLQEARSKVNVARR